MQSTPYPRAAQAYSDVGLETGVIGADPHRLIDMLYEGALVAIARARACMCAGDIEAKGRSISKAVQIIEEGLKASLNVDAGGELARQLWQLYEYTARRLLLASVRNETAGLDEVSGLLQGLRQAWRQIDPRAAKRTAAIAA